METLVTTLLWGKETLELEEVTAALLAYNQRRQQTEGISGEGLVAKGREERGRKSERGRTGARGKSKSRGRTPEPKELKCYKCHETGHFKKDCPYRKKNGGKGTWKEAGPSKSANVVEESSDDCDGDMLSVSTNAEHGADSWILDSACSFHMSPNREWFDTYRGFRKPRLVRSPANSSRMYRLSWKVVTLAIHRQWDRLSSRSSNSNNNRRA
ncbi:hypothetical protein Vadar_013515 [Vaccinium darrowii]|uniref:Uncharacterized protein n=1 Tax=Vaccinium darrowii TaxID=229202 RepID=A0ACB7Y7T6_9ERIC|nr:hypothetical protein Vadar_013515 [Vaccinium darrowii]